MDKTREFLVLRLRNFQGIVLSEPEHIGNFPNLHLCTFNIFLLNLGAVIEIFYFVSTNFHLFFQGERITVARGL